MRGGLVGSRLLTRIRVISKDELWWNFARPTWSLACKKICFQLHSMGSVEKYIFTPASSGKSFLLGPKYPTFLCNGSEWRILNNQPTPAVASWAPVSSVSFSDSISISINTTVISWQYKHGQEKWIQSQMRNQNKGKTKTNIKNFNIKIHNLIYILVIITFEDRM